MKTIKDLYDSEGNYISDASYTEIFRLDEMLNQAKIPHTFRTLFDGYQIHYPAPHHIMDVIQHLRSFGGSENMLEIMGLLTEEEAAEDSVLGYLSANEVFERIKAHWEKENEE